MEEQWIKDREKRKLKNEKNFKNLLTNKKTFDILWPSNKKFFGGFTNVQSQGH